MHLDRLVVHINTHSILNYNFFDFFLSNLTGSFFVKNGKIKAISKVYCILNNISVTFNNSYEIF
jgi:hypothetical protein